MFLEGLDALDQKIVRLLIENARISYSDIGQEVGISRVAVKARIQALEQRGIIEEYTTIINPQKISGAVSCYFEIETLPDTLAEVTETLKENEAITQVYRVTGKNKLHVHAVAASSEEMEKLIRGHRPAARRGQLQLQHHFVPHQGYQGPKAVERGSPKQLTEQATKSSIPFMVVRTWTTLLICAAENGFANENRHFLLECPK